MILAGSRNKKKKGKKKANGQVDSGGRAAESNGVKHEAADAEDEDEEEEESAGAPVVRMYPHSARVESLVLILNE